jgi:hypothetical protein
MAVIRAILVVGSSGVEMAIITVEAVTIPAAMTVVAEAIVEVETAAVVGID